MKKEISTQQTPDNITHVLALLVATPQALESLSAGQGDEQLRAPLGPGERSFAEVLAHLINTESRSAESILLALALDEPALPPIHPERHYGVLLRHDLLPVAESLAYFRYRRAVVLRLLHSLTEVQWARTIREAGKQRRESVYWRARGLALHEAEHLAWLAARLPQ